MKMWRLSEEDLKKIQDRLARASPRVVSHSTDERKTVPVDPTQSQKPRRGRPRNNYQRDLYQQIVALGLPMPYPEHKFHAERGWRVDLAWPEFKFAVEIEGVVHRIKDRYLRDVDKYNELTLAGWVLIRVTNRQVKSGVAIGLVERMFAMTK